LAGGKFLLSSPQQSDISSLDQPTAPKSTSPAVAHDQQPSREVETTDDQPEPSPIVYGLAKDVAERFPPHNNIERARNATVSVTTAWGSGSGFFIDSRGHIISNRHVVQFDADKLDKLRSETEDLRDNLADEEKNLSYYRKELALIHDKGMKARFKKQLESREANYNKYYDLYEKLKKELAELEDAANRQEIKIMTIDGQEFHAETISLSEKLDLVLLRIYAGNTPHITSADHPLNIDQGQKVFTIGNPAGLKYTVTSGIISGFREIEGKKMIQTDAPINPGNSGGPLIDDEGNVLGINTMIMRDTEGIGFAIPIQEVYKEFSYYLSNSTF
jgi:S1-C subfamily serine protease